MATTVITNYQAVLGGTNIQSDTTNIAGSDFVKNAVSLTQSEYDALGAYDVNTVYLIVDQA